MYYSLSSKGAAGRGGHNKSPTNSPIQYRPRAVVVLWLFLSPENHAQRLIQNLDLVRRGVAKVYRHSRRYFFFARVLKTMRNAATLIKLHHITWVGLFYRLVYVRVSRNVHFQCRIGRILCYNAASEQSQPFHWYGLCYGNYLHIT